MNTAGGVCVCVCVEGGEVTLMEVLLSVTHGPDPWQTDHGGVCAPFVIRSHSSEHILTLLTQTSFCQIHLKYLLPS